ncbi:MAG: hypothetical protein ACRCVT_01970 [Leadbetterella sp.]
MKNIYIFILLYFSILSPILSQDNSIDLLPYMEVNFKPKDSKEIKSIVVDNVEIGTIIKSTGFNKFVTQNGDYTITPESYNIQVTLIKDSKNKIIGLSQKRKDKYIIGCQDRIFTLEKNYDNLQYKLQEHLPEQLASIEQSPKVLVLNTNSKNKMVIHHRIDAVPIELIPVLENTLGIDKTVNRMRLWSAISSIPFSTIYFLIRNKNTYQ